MDSKELLEARLKHIADILESIESMEDYLNDLNIEIPEFARTIIEKMINSEEINEIVDGIKEQRPPKLALIGRSGVGKSSLINAMTGTYLAETSAVEH